MGLAASEGWEFPFSPAFRTGCRRPQACPQPDSLWWAVASFSDKGRLPPTVTLPTWFPAWCTHLKPPLLSSSPSTGLLQPGEPFPAWPSQGRSPSQQLPSPLLERAVFLSPLYKVLIIFPGSLGELVTQSGSSPSGACAGQKQLVPGLGPTSALKPLTRLIS